MSKGTPRCSRQKFRLNGKASDYKYPFHHWTPPKLVYPCRPSEKDALHVLKNLFGPLESYKELETKAVSQNTLVSLETPLSDGHIAFLENTAERCTSPTTKHSAEGMQGARHWVQRVDTPDGLFQRLTDGYGVSLMFGERCHQYIRNSNNWRGISGVQLDLDVWYQQPDALKKKLEAEDRDADFIAERLDANEKLPLPVYSQSELFERYPLDPAYMRIHFPNSILDARGTPFQHPRYCPIPRTPSRICASTVPLAICSAPNSIVSPPMLQKILWRSVLGIHITHHRHTEMIISIQPGSTIDSKNPQSLSSTSPNTESESNSRKINAKRIIQAYPGMGKATARTYQRS